MSIKVANEASFLESSSHLRFSGWCFLDLLISDQDGTAFPGGSRKSPGQASGLCVRSWQRRIGAGGTCESGFRMSLGPKQSRAGGRFTGEDGRGGFPWN